MLKSCLAIYQKWQFSLKIIVILMGCFPLLSGCNDESSIFIYNNYRCDQQIDSAESILQSGNIVLFGEVHGTIEVPEFISTLTCQAAKSGLTVRVGLEIPKQEQSLVNQFILSPLEKPDTMTLVASEFWTRELQDGRSSRAMLNLLKTIHELFNAGYPVDVFLFDDLNAYGQGLGFRDSTMAENILMEYSETPNAMFIILTGNVHSRLIPGYPWNPNSTFVPMGARLISALPATRSFNLSHAGGTAWLCTGNPSVCTSKELEGSDMGSNLLIKWFSDEFPPTRSSDAGHDGIFYVGAITASPPTIGN